MKKKSFASDKHNLSGYAAVDLKNSESLNALANRIIPQYNPERFEAVALRLFVKKGEPILTLFAIDNAKQEKSKLRKGKIPVRKFKLSIEFTELLSQIKQFDFTVKVAEFNIEDILVVNK